MDFVCIVTYGVVSVNDIPIFIDLQICSLGSLFCLIENVFNHCILHRIFTLDLTPQSKHLKLKLDSNNILCHNRIGVIRIK
jgi:hypothetical protein